MIALTYNSYLILIKINRNHYKVLEINLKTFDHRTL